MDYNSKTMAVATTSESLPIELLELIVDEVSAERLTLKSCLSVSRSFRHCSLRHLYKSVEIFVEAHIFEGRPQESTTLTRISALNEIISPPSCLDIQGVGRYIKTFVLSIISWRLDPFWNSPANSTRLFQLMGNKSLLAVMRGLCGEGYGVQQFYLHVVPHRPIKLAELPKEFSAAFQALTQSPYLKTLQVQNMTFLPHTKPVSGYDIHLKYLQPDISSEQTFGHGGVGADGDSDQLERLHTDHSFPHESISPQVLRTLKKVVAYNDGPEDSVKTWEIVKMAASSLRTVCIFHSNEITPVSDSFNLDQLPNLERFAYIRSCLPPISQNASEFMSNLEMIHRLLQVNQPMRFLKTLNLDIAIRPIEIGALYLLDPNVEDLWRSVDFLLAGDNYPSLSKIRLDVHFYAVDVPPRALNFIEALTRSLEERFPCLSSLKISFKLDVRELKF